MYINMCLCTYEGIYVYVCNRKIENPRSEILSLSRAVKFFHQLSSTGNRSPRDSGLGLRIKGNKGTRHQTPNYLPTYEDYH